MEAQGRLQISREKLGQDKHCNMDDFDSYIEYHIIFNYIINMRRQFTEPFVFGNILE